MYNYLEIAKGIAIESGNAALKLRQINSLDEMIKPDGTQVTSGDDISNFLVMNLSDLTKIPILTEEMGENEYFVNLDLYSKSGRVWIVDPLDGTKEYASGNGNWAVSIALIDEGTPVIGVIYSPRNNLLVWSEKGRGSFIKNDDYNFSPLLCSSEQNLENMTLLLSPNEFDKYDSFRNVLYQNAYTFADPRIKWLGSTALKTGLVALGKGDVYFTLTHPGRITKEWDIAAGDLIVREAGGLITDTEGNDFFYGKRDPGNYSGIFASNSLDRHFKIMDHFLRQ